MVKVKLGKISRRDNISPDESGHTVLDFENYINELFNGITDVIKNKYKGPLLKKFWFNIANAIYEDEVENYDSKEYKINSEDDLFDYIEDSLGKELKNDDIKSKTKSSLPPAPISSYGKNVDKPKSPRSPEYAPSGGPGGSYAVGYSPKYDDRYSPDKYSDDDKYPYDDRYPDDSRYDGYEGYGYSGYKSPEKEDFSVKKISSKSSSPQNKESLVLSPKPVMHSKSPEKASEVPQAEEFASEQAQPQPSKITKETENPVSGFSSSEGEQSQETGEEMNVDLGNPSISAQLVQSQLKEMKDLTNEEKEQQRLKALRKEIKRDVVPRTKDTTRQLAEKKRQIEKLQEEMEKLDADNQRAFNAGVKFVNQQLAAQQQATASVNQARLNLLNNIQNNFISSVNQLSSRNLNNPPLTTLVLNMIMRNPNSLVFKIISDGLNFAVSNSSGNNQSDVLNVYNYVMANLRKQTETMVNSYLVSFQLANLSEQEKELNIRRRQSIDELYRKIRNMINLNVYSHPIITGNVEVDLVGDNTINTLQYLFALLLLTDGNVNAAYNSFLLVLRETKKMMGGAAKRKNKRSKNRKNNIKKNEIKIKDNKKKVEQKRSKEVKVKKIVKNKKK